MPGRRTGQRGFTLIELVMVIVLLGVMAGVLTPFILSAMEAYTASRARADLVAKGRLALERMAREVRRAVPNSLSVVDSGNGIEFAHSCGGGRYVEQFDSYGGAFSKNNYRFKTNANRSYLYVVGNNAMTGLATDCAATDTLVIGNYSPADLQGGDTRVSLAGIADTTLASDGTDYGQLLSYSSGHQFLTASPGKHFTIADKVIEVGRLSGDATLRWHSVSGFGDYNLGADWDASDPILVNGVSSVNFAYTPGSVATNGILRIDLLLSATGGETIRLYHEVQIRNAP
jgi:MSHA biogenesis protein MshO